MSVFEIAVILLLAAGCALALAALIVAAGNRRRLADAERAAHGAATGEDLADVREQLRDDIDSSRRETVEYMYNAFKNYSDLMTGTQVEQARRQSERLTEINQTLAASMDQTERRLEFIRQSMNKQIGDLTQENSRQLDRMRETVDEKLQKTLDDRLSQSFRLVNERLEQVYKGLGEMQNLAAGVGDLKKVLSNVKTRGILGEVQLSAILEQILAPEQYETNVVTKSTGTERVEFAVKLPGAEEGGRPVYLPIDAKFPGDAYARLNDAYESGDRAEIEAAARQLEQVIKAEAKDIRDKYLEPPYTTEFGIMFLPFEGLYAEVVRRGLLETLQREYKVNIAGPTTMAALLNSLQMGFRTLAIQKHSGEVWEVLGAVKTEFDKFEEVLEKTRNRINQANTELDKLIGPRTRSIRRTLRSVENLEEDRAVSLLGLTELENEGEFKGTPDID